MSKILSFLGIKEKEQSFEAIISPHMSNLFKVAYQYTGTKHDAEDLLQDLLEYLFTKQTELRKIEKLKPWLMRCLYNRFIDLYRKKQRQPGLDDIDDEKIQPLFQYYDNHQQNDQHKEIYQAMNKLSADQRAVITLHDINGHTLPELAKIMDVPLGTLKSNLHRARATLKQHISLQPSELNVRHY
ncbi:RNA polymerase sigma factor [Pseudocolwellia agarivorans]|uniref:RNA polymerase sigma factor n=1 Tax=Pseudocolwellia agarivorans TaxID=1911682 RepID=UPI0009861434|nr:RNA polymerase sigma factor [Pseudocolwellia agarivorans]